MLCAMRKISLSLVMTVAALWNCSAHAAPDSSENTTKAPANSGILTHIDQVRQNVSLKASDLVGDAIDLIGVPYRRGGNTAENGFDCSGFVRSVYQKSIGLLLPRKAEEQAYVTQRIHKTDLRPGDLVFFNTMRRAFSHVGIYVGEGKFIHSPKPGSEVRIDSMDMDYWQGRFDGARRVPETMTSSFQASALQTVALQTAGLQSPTLQAAAPLSVVENDPPARALKPGKHKLVETPKHNSKKQDVKKQTAKGPVAKGKAAKAQTAKGQTAKAKTAKTQTAKAQTAKKQSASKHASAAAPKSPKAKKHAKA
jgi:hypothetical protein